MLSTLSIFLAVVIFLEILFLTSRTRHRETALDIEVDERRELFAGETYDYSGEYRIVRFYKTDERNFGEDWDWNDLTLVSQGTVSTLAGLPRIVEFFSGPISFSVFCPGIDASVASAAIEKLKECNEGVRKRVTFNLVYPAEQPAEVAGLEDALTCDKLESFLNNYPETPIKGGPIPWNILRNVGRSATHSEFFLNIDPDAIPSKELRFNFKKIADEGNLWDADDKTIYILEENNQENESFLQNEEVDASSISIFGTEKNIPLFVARRNIPFYDERFKTHRLDRLQLFCELYTAGYSFKRISSHLENAKRSEMNEETGEMEWLLFNYHFKDELHQKYSTNKTCPWISSSGNSHAHNSDFLRYRVQQNEMGKPVATQNEPPISAGGSSGLTNALLPNHDHTKKLHVEGVAHYSLDEMHELYEKGLSADVMKEFRAPNEDDLTWELD